MKKGVLDSGHCMTFQRSILQNYGGFLGLPQTPYGVITCGTNIAKKKYPSIAKAHGGSQIWKKMMDMREKVEHEIWWQLKVGISNFWLDN